MINLVHCVRRLVKVKTQANRFIKTETLFELLAVERCRCIGLVRRERR